MEKGARRTSAEGGNLNHLGEIRESGDTAPFGKSKRPDVGLGGGTGMVKRWLESFSKGLKLLQRTHEIMVEGEG